VLLSFVLLFDRRVLMSFYDSVCFSGSCCLTVLVLSVLLLAMIGVVAAAVLVSVDFVYLSVD